MPANQHDTPRIDANIGQTVADSLWTYERMLDQALAAGARYTATLTEARLETGTSAVLGSEVFTHVTESLAKVGEARASLVASHTALDVVRRKAGLGAVAAGPFWDKRERSTGALPSVVSDRTAA